MTIRFHWGTGITIVISLFCISILAVVYSAFQEPVFMVSDDYYAEEIRYQEKIDQMKNVAALSTKPELRYLAKEKLVILQLPSDTQVAEGNIHFFRPSDSRMDFNSQLEDNGQNAWQFNALRMQPGLWKVKLTWKDFNQTKFYSEHTLVVP